MKAPARFDAQALAARYGTPLLIIDYDRFDADVARFCGSAQRDAIEVAYAGKALLLTALARRLKETPLHLDVSSLGELATAERARFPAHRINLHGSGKGLPEIEAVAAGRVGRVIVDGLEEIEQLKARVCASRPIPLLLRLNTGIEAHTHEFVRTAGSGSKFGLDPAALDAALEQLRDAPQLHFLGLHGHIGSQITAPAAFEAHADALMECAALCAARGFACERIVCGGGFGVAARPSDPEPFDAVLLLRNLSSRVRATARARHLPVPQIGIEPGRALIAQAGSTLYTVLGVKEQFGRRYVIVDGGLFENPRPALYGAQHHVYCASPRTGEAIQSAICGRTCENDRLATADLPVDLRAGDLLVMETTGAYTYSMGSNYNRLPRPAVVALEGARDTLIARRERTEDLLEMDLDA